MGCSSKYVPLFINKALFFFLLQAACPLNRTISALFFFSASIKTILRSRKKFDIFCTSETPINIH